MHGIERNSTGFQARSVYSRYHTRLRRDEHLTLRRQRNDTLTLQASQTDFEDDDARRDWSFEP